MTPVMRLECSKLESRCEKMDEYVKGKLTERNLEELIPTFEAEKLYQETLVLLDDVTLTSLIPVIGLHLQFQKYFKKISQDFSVLNSGCASKLTENWVPVFKDKILQVGRREKQALHLLYGVDTMSADWYQYG